MKTLITYLLSGLFVLLLNPFTISAQSVANYATSRSTGITYNSIISTGQSFASWRYTGSFSEDDNRSGFTNIGFDFWYNGVRYTQFSISTNGFIDFSASTDDGGPQCDDYGYCNTNFTANTVGNGTWAALAPFHDDMTTRQGVDPLGISMKYQLSGTAPNRILIIEWDGMAVYNDTSPDLNFQVILHESTGVIEYNYETMDNGSSTFSYTTGINASSVSATPTTSELLTLQTANTSTFSNTVQNNLSTLPAPNSKYAFTPPVPNNPVGNLTFNNITSTGMTLNWSDWASNEVGYAIYSSTDDVNYFFSAQTTSNATSSAISGLLPATTYYWRVYAMTEGALSTALSGTQITSPPMEVISIQSGRWDKNNTWDCNCIPSAGDNVTIQNGHVVTMRSTGSACNDLTIGQGSSGELRIGRNNTNTYDLTINGNTTINSGAVFQTRTVSNTTHRLNVRGNIINNGTFNMQTDGNSFTAVNFMKTDGDQTVTGNGSTTNFYTIDVTKALKSNVLEISSNVFTCDPNALTIVDAGTVKFSSSGTNTFSLYNTTRDIPMTGSIIMESPNSTLSFAASVNLRGDITLNSGTIEIGDATNENIISFGGQLTINGGAISIAGRYDRSDSEETANFMMTSGTLTVASVGSTSNTRPPFGIDVVGSTFNMSGGTIMIERAGGSNLGYTNTGASYGTVTGGTLQIGNSSTPNSQIIQVNSSKEVGNLLVNSNNATAQLVNNDLDVIADIDLTVGRLDPNGRDITLGGDWTVTGGNHNATSGEVIFTGAAQSITTNASAFNDLTLSGSSVKTFNDNLVANGSLTINSTVAFANTGFIAEIGGDWINNGTFNRSGETIIFNGTTDQDISGTSSTEFTNITVNKSGGRVLIETTVGLAQTLDIQTATEFDADGASNTSAFSLLSSLNEESRVGTLPVGAQISGTLRAEKHLPVDGTKRWRFISSIVQNAPVSDLQNEIPISGDFTGSDNGTGTIPLQATGSLAYYDNTIGTVDQTLDDRWFLYPSNNNGELLTASGSIGRGYTIWIRDLGAVTYDLTGTLNQGTIDYAPTGNFERWNLIANPYPSSINWDAPSGWTKSGIQGNAIHVWSGTQYLTWNGAIGSLNNGLIAKGTSYFIEGSADNMTLISTESVKSTSTGTTHKSEHPRYIELKISDETNEDKAYIQFVEGASQGLDEYDASKLTNAIFNLATLSENEKNLSINAIDNIDCNLTIPLNIYYISTGNYQMGWEHLSTLSGAVDIQLVDAFTTTTYALKKDDQINFEVTSDPNSYGSNRFTLVFNSIEIDNSLETIGVPACEADNVHLRILKSQPDITYQVIKDEKVLFTAAGDGNDLLFNVDKSSLHSGLNIFELNATNTFCQQQASLAPVSIHHIYTPEVVYDKDVRTLTTNLQEELQWYKNNAPFGEKGINSIKLDQESATYYVGVSNENCSLNSELFTYIEIDCSLTTVGVQPCDTDYANIGIEHTQQGVEYFITQKEETIFTTMGTGEDVFFKLSIQSLDTGLNTFEVRAVNNISQQEKYLVPISFTYIVTPDILYNTETGLLTTSSQHGLQWYKNDMPIGEIGLDTLKLDQQESAVYTVSVTNTGCTLTSEPFTFETITGLRSHGISIYPTPIQEVLNIDLTYNDDITNGHIINASGTVVTPQINFSSRQSSLNFEKLPTGVYFLKLIGEQSTYTIKLMKQ